MSSSTSFFTKDQFRSLPNQISATSYVAVELPNDFVSGRELTAKELERVLDDYAGVYIGTTDRGYSVSLFNITPNRTVDGMCFFVRPDSALFNVIQREAQSHKLASS